jgi:hypothetical protein
MKITYKQCGNLLGCPTLYIYTSWFELEINRRDLWTSVITWKPCIDYEEGLFIIGFVFGYIGVKIPFWARFKKRFSNPDLELPQGYTAVDDDSYGWFSPELPPGVTKVRKTNELWKSSISASEII